MSAISKNTKIEQTIIRIVKERKPQTVEQLVILTKEELQIQEQEILKSILRLQSEGKISFKRQPTQSPPNFTVYLKTEQTLWYWITITIAIVTAIIVFVILEDFYPWVYIRYVFGAIFVLWLPGYTFIKALFPVGVPLKTSEKNLDIIVRIALSLGMSLALVPIVGLLLNYTPWGIRLTSIVLSLLALTLAFATAALIREHRTRIKMNEETLQVE